MCQPVCVPRTLFLHQAPSAISCTLCNKASVIAQDSNEKAARTIAVGASKYVLMIQPLESHWVSGIVVWEDIGRRRRGTFGFEDSRVVGASLLLLFLIGASIGGDCRGSKKWLESGVP
jgi:hypothetical protein